MDLWIRSQDKTKLVKINSLEYVEYKDIHSINGYYTNEADNYDLGIYSSKERALEVLDEIHKLLTPKMIVNNEGRDCVALDGTIYITNIVSSINSDIQQLSTYVYEMPEE